MNWFGRGIAQATLAAAVSLGASSAQAQTYPTRNITMIVPFAAGGPTDVISRIVTGQMAPGLGQSIIIENVVGAETACARFVLRWDPSDAIWWRSLGRHVGTRIEIPFRTSTRPNA